MPMTGVPGPGAVWLPVVSGRSVDGFSVSVPR